MIDIKDVKPSMVDILPLVGMEICCNIFGNTEILDHALFNLSHYLNRKCHYTTKQDADHLSQKIFEVNCLDVF
jgi:hypothetical protein